MTTTKEIPMITTTTTAATSIEWAYSEIRLLPTDIVETIARRTPPEAWDAVSARLSDLLPEIYCEQHGAWEPEDTDCSGAGDRFRLTDTRPGAVAMFAPTLLEA